MDVLNSFSPGSRYVSIFVKDLEPYLKRIKEWNIRLLSKINPMVAPEGYKGIVLQDPDGASPELIWLPKIPGIVWIFCYSGIFT